MFSLEERVNVIERSKKGEKAVNIAMAIGVGKTQIQSIIKDQESILARWQGGQRGERKTNKRQKDMYGDLNDKIWTWFSEARRRKIPLSGRLIQEKALMLSVELGLDDFCASNGWLYKWHVFSILVEF